MLKIVLFALICLSSVANASSGFYISASSLTSKENASTKTLVNTSVTTSVDASSVTYSENMAGVQSASPLDRAGPFRYVYIFTDDERSSSDAVIPKSISEFNNEYITQQIKFTLFTGDDTIIQTDPYSQISDNSISTNTYRTYTINPIDYTSQIATVKSMVSSAVSGTTTTSKTTTTPNFTINNTGGFELSTGYKFQKQGGNFFFAPQIDYSSFGSNSTPLRISGLSAVTKFGVSISKASIYGLGGLAFVSNSSNGSTQNIGGIKYGIGTELNLSKRFALFAEVFQIDLQNSLSYSSQSSSYSQSSSVKSYSPSNEISKYIQDNSNPSQVIIKNNTSPKYILTLNNLGLKHKIDPNSIKYTQTSNTNANITNITSITSIQGFKVGLTFYFDDGIRLREKSFAEEYGLLDENFVTQKAIMNGVSEDDLYNSLLSDDEEFDNYWLNEEERVYDGWLSNEEEDIYDNGLSGVGFKRVKIKT